MKCLNAYTILAVITPGMRQSITGYDLNIMSVLSLYSQNKDDGSRIEGYILWISENKEKSRQDIW